MEKQKTKALANIFYQAFSDKIQYFWFWTDDKDLALQLIEEGLNPNQVVYLTDDQGQIVAAATVETKGSPDAIQLPYSIFKKYFGPVGGFIRKCVYSIYKSSQKDLDLGEMYVDLAAVKASERGQGYGGQLFERLEKVASKANLHKVSLNVVDTNKAGKRFYEKNGYKESHYEKMNPLFKQFTKRAGFTGAYTMVKYLD